MGAGPLADALGHGDRLGKVREQIEAMGFRRSPFSYSKGEGKGSTSASYYSAPVAGLKGIGRLPRMTHIPEFVAFAVLMGVFLRAKL
jgi:hypothetical protein